MTNPFPGMNPCMLAQRRLAPRQSGDLTGAFAQSPTARHRSAGGGRARRGSNLQEVLNLVYRQGRYDAVIDYTAESPANLNEKDRAWLNGLLREKGLR